jgi:hypothetical protein
MKRGSENNSTKALKNKEIICKKKHDDVANYDCLRIIADVDSLHVKRIQLSGLLLFRYYR